MLARKGFFAVSFDPPGTWESRGSIDLFSTTNYIKAVNELIEYYGNKPTLLMGHSRGGSIAILTGAENPNVIGLVLVMVNYKVPTPPKPEALELGYNLEFRDLPPGTSKSGEQKEFRLPLAYFKDGKKYNSGDVIVNIHMPKLMFYSRNDKYTSTDGFLSVFSAVPEPKVKHELNCIHDYRYSPEAVEEVNKVTSEFLDQFFK